MFVVVNAIQTSKKLILAHSKPILFITVKPFRALDIMRISLTVVGIS
jgi:hypothetical protein